MIFFIQDWLPVVAMKQAAFHAMAEFYQSVVAQKAKSYGEQIARLKVCPVSRINQVIV